MSVQLPLPDDLSSSYPWTAEQAEERAAVDRWNAAVQRDNEEWTTESWAAVGAAAAEIRTIRERMYRKRKVA